MALLEVRDLVYGTDAERRERILDGLSLSVAQGEVHALLGANGTGKSTLAYLIMGCEPYAPNAGDILFRGRSLLPLPLYERARLGISLAWQEPVRFEGISVHDYLALQSSSTSPDETLRLVGLNPDRCRNRMVDTSLSGGERKRIELASVLSVRPQLALLDEPDSGIDMLSTQDLINVINAFKERGSAVLLITHRQEIALISDRASQLCNGRIICSGAPANVAAHYQSRQCLVCDGRECHYV